MSTDGTTPYDILAEIGSILHRLRDEHGAVPCLQIEASVPASVGVESVVSMMLLGLRSMSDGWSGRLDGGPGLDYQCDCDLAGDWIKVVTMVRLKIGPPLPGREELYVAEFRFDEIKGGKR